VPAFQNLADSIIATSTAIRYGLDGREPAGDRAAPGVTRMNAISETNTVLDGVVASMQAPIRDYVRLVEEVAGDSLKGLTLFGRIVGPSFDPTRSTARNVMVTERADLGMLRRLSEHGLRLGRVGIAAPLVMTPEYIEASCDTFPLEFIEIKQRRLTLRGEDFFGDLSFKDGDVRLQCERELKVLLIGLRQGLLSAAGREKFIEAVAADVGEAVLRALRGVLWLKGMKDDQPDGEVIDETQRIVGRKLPGVRRAMDPDATIGWSEFETLYGDVEALGEWVNAW